MGAPLQGNVDQIAVRALTNEAMANRLSKLKDNRRAFDKSFADALLEEASRRFQWREAYDKMDHGA